MSAEMLGAKEVAGMLGLAWECGALAGTAWSGRALDKAWREGGRGSMVKEAAMAVWDLVRGRMSGAGYGKRMA